MIFFRNELIRDVIRHLNLSADGEWGEPAGPQCRPLESLFSTIDMVL